MILSDHQDELRFWREISKKQAGIRELKKTLAEILPNFHVCGVEAELLGDVAGTAKEKELLLYQKAEAMPHGEPLKFTYEPDPDHSIVIYVYADRMDFTETEKESLEMLAAGCRFVLEESLFCTGAGSESLSQAVTGLPNTDGFLARVAALREEGADFSEYSAICFNLKGFGEVNRRFGRKKGNEVMKLYAGILQGIVRGDEALGHLGWDYFTVLIRKSRQKRFLHHIRNMEVRFDADGIEEKVRISATVGIWEIEDGLKDLEDVVSKPYTALNQARNILHAGVAYASDDMIRLIRQRESVIKYYKEALENEEFQVYYQPKVDSRTGLLVGAEGLVRWFRDGEMISPGVFIPSLEEDGRILDLDYYVLRHACRDIREWVEKGYDPVTVSVNFSRKDLKDPRLAENINQIIEESGIDKSLIQVELTETVDVEEHGELSGFIEKLYRMNIMTAIDDFGSGYSSLATLREFRVHTLKIDRSFVNDDDFSWKDEIILRDIIHMAGELGMEILCEGVERVDQLALLNSVGCYVIQGFYYDRPLPRNEFEKRLIAKNYS